MLEMEASRNNDSITHQASKVSGSFSKLSEAQIMPKI
jgi:hypothetical protein